MRPDRSQLQHIIDLVADSTVRVEIADVLPLTEAGHAQLRSESGHTRGKLVLRVDRR